MKYTPAEPHLMARLELTRRNLLSLLAKLDGNPSGSACTIIDPTHSIAVVAVEDDEHYSDRTPGPVHEDTLRIIAGWSDKTDWLPEHEDDSD